jgi:hypothetical protein
MQGSHCYPLAASCQTCEELKENSVHVKRALLHMRQPNALHTCGRAATGSDGGMRKAHAAWGRRQAAIAVAACRDLEQAERARRARTGRHAALYQPPALTRCDGSELMCIPPLHSAARLTGPNACPPSGPGVSPTTLAGMHRWQCKGCILVAAATTTSAPTPGTEQALILSSTSSKAARRWQPPTACKV